MHFEIKVKRVLLLIFLSVFLIGCEKKTQEVVITQDYLAYCNVSAEEWLEDKSVYMNYYMDDKNNLHVTYSPEQIEQLLGWNEEQLISFADSFSELKQGYQIIYENDYQEKKYYFDKDLDEDTFRFYLALEEPRSVFYQLLKGREEYQLFDNLKIYDSNTGVFITEAKNGEITFSYSDWETIEHED